MSWLARTWQRFWFAPTPLTRLAAFRIVILVLGLNELFASASTVFADAAAVDRGVVEKPWSPIVLFQALGLQPIGEREARAVFWIGLLACSCGILGLATRFACLVAACTCTYWAGLVYSFGKVHHEKVTLTFALFALVLAPAGARLSLDSLIGRLRRAWCGEDPCWVPDQSDLAGVPLRLAQVTMALGYTFAGLTKLAVSGPEWANGYTLMAYCLQFDNVLSHALSEHLWLARLLSIGALFVQATFLAVLFLPRLSWFYLPAVVLFHLSTWWSMDTGPYVTLWLCGAAFLPLERIPNWLARAWRAGGLRRISAFGLALSTSALCLWVLFLVLPRWGLILVLPLVLALSLRVRGRTREVDCDLDSRRGRLRCALRAAFDWGGVVRWRGRAPA